MACDAVCVEQRTKVQTNIPMKCKVVFFFFKQSSSFITSQSDLTTFRSNGYLKTDSPVLTAPIVHRDLDKAEVRLDVVWVNHILHELFACAQNGARVRF